MQQDIQVIDNDLILHIKQIDDIVSNYPSSRWKSKCVTTANVRKLLL